MNPAILKTRNIRGTPLFVAMALLHWEGRPDHGIFRVTPQAVAHTIGILGDEAEHAFQELERLGFIARVEADWIVLIGAYWCDLAERLPLTNMEKTMMLRSLKHGPRAAAQLFLKLFGNKLSLVQMASVPEITAQRSRVAGTIAKLDELLPAR